MRVIPIAITATLVALSAACGGSSTGTPTPTGSRAIESAVTTTQGPNKSATPRQETASVAATAPGVTPTAPPVSTQGTPAAIPEDETSFVRAMSGRSTTSSDCTYNPSTDIADCGGVLYSLDPPIVAEGITCSLWHVDDQPYAVSCTQLEPQGSHFYQIQ